MASPAFVLVELAFEHANQVRLIADLAALARRAGGTVHAFGVPGRVAVLEPGSVAASLLIVRFATRDLARHVAVNTLAPRALAAVPATHSPTVLVADALPEIGLPALMDIPTTASVPRPPPIPTNAFLVVRGTAWDAARLEEYRDVILPMHKERGGFYEAFAVAAGEVEAVCGQWSEQIFAISRWPSRAAAEDFWFSDRYQTEAIPHRLGAGRFSVHLLEASEP